MITGKILKTHGWPEGKVMGAAKNAATQLEASGLPRDEVLATLDRVRAQPDSYAGDPVLGTLAAACLRLQPRTPTASAEDLRPQPVSYGIWGAEQIDAAALTQMDSAMRLPISVAGALMPDAHVGYGLPIGGVLATEGAVIPFAVGVDIACRMRLSIYPQPPDELRQKQHLFTRALLGQTRFGAGAAWQGRERSAHEVLDDPVWNVTKLLKSLQDKAHEQLGTSGTGR